MCTHDHDDVTVEKCGPSQAARPHGQSSSNIFIFRLLLEARRPRNGLTDAPSHNPVFFKSRQSILKKKNFLSFFLTFLHSVLKGFVILCPCGHPPLLVNNNLDFSLTHRSPIAHRERIRFACLSPLSCSTRITSQLDGSRLIGLSPRRCQVKNQVNSKKKKERNYSTRWCNQFIK